MTEEHRTKSSDPLPPSSLQPKNQTNPPDSSPSRGWSDIWSGLLRLGLGETTLRVATGLASLLLILLVVWVMGNFYLKGDLAAEQPAARSAVQAAVLPTATLAPEVPLPPFLLPEGDLLAGGIPRLALIRTTVTNRMRIDVVQYEVKKGDTLFGIAEKFNLKPQTLLWGNFDILKDDPHSLRPGQQLNILPVDGTYYKSHAGDTLAGIARFFGVKAEDIFNWPGNKMSVQDQVEIGQIKVDAGTWLVVPGGKREFATWSMPRITRSNPSVAKVLGPGSCGVVQGGAIGVGSFRWPAPMKIISGYDYSPATNHWGIDIACRMGDPIYAVDSGVVVYSGWNNYGYGNIVIIDHGNGWQSLYAHLTSSYTACGASVAQGVTIGGCGSTGNSTGAHLHFELMSASGYRVNPWDFLSR